MDGLWLEISAIVLLILLNGFFAMSEMALVSAKKVRLRKLAKAGDRNAQSALELKREPERFLSTVQVGITLVGVLTGVYGGATIADNLAHQLSTVPALAPYAPGLGLAMVVAGIAYLTLILGELVPKRLAMAWPERLAGVSAPLMRVLMAITMPVVYVLTLSTRLVLSIIGVEGKEASKVTEDDIRGMIAEGARVGVVDRAEEDMLERIFRLGDRQVGAIMTHRSRIVWLDMESTPEEIMRVIQESPYSRFPVAKGSLEDILGVIKAKDLLTSCAGGKPLDISQHLLEPLFVPESMKAFQLLELFKTKPRMHFALIIDEYGDIQGLVTLNDILEAIVGDIPSVGEESEPGSFQREDGSWLMDALMPIDEVMAILDRRLPEEDQGDYHTLAGFVLQNLGRIPSLGDVFHWKDYRFEIVDMDGTRVDKVLIAPVQPNV